MVTLTDRPDMTLDVYRGCKTTTQQQQNHMQTATQSLEEYMYEQDGSMDG